MNSSVRDHFTNGLTALQNGRYTTAVTEFRGAISAGRHSEQQLGLGPAYFLLALALLGGRNPAAADQEKITEIEQHIRLAQGYTGSTAALQATVLLAIVQDDFYRYHDSPPVPMDRADLDRVLAQLSKDDLQPLVRHIGRASGEAWQATCRRAGLLDSQPAPYSRFRDPERPAAVSRYFTPAPPARNRSRFAWAFAAAALLIVVALLTRNLGSILFVAAAAVLIKVGASDVRGYRSYLREYDQAEPKPSDWEMDNWLDEDIEELKHRVAERVMLNTTLKSDGGDLVQPAQAVVGLPDEAHRGTLRLRHGDDGLLRANAYEVMIMFLTDSLVSVYHCQIDFHLGEVTLDQITEWHYRDIVSVVATHRPMPKSVVETLRQQDREYVKDRPMEQIFTLSACNGESISIGTGFSGSGDFNGEIAWSNDSALRVIRQMVRDRHAAV
jgi:hypothetical protein